MNLNDLLTKQGLDTKLRKHIVVMRHRPHEQALRKVLPWLAAEKLDLFGAYQQTQNENANQNPVHLYLQNPKTLSSAPNSWEFRFRV